MKQTLEEQHPVRGKVFLWEYQMVALVYSSLKHLKMSKVATPPPNVLVSVTEVADLVKTHQLLEMVK